MNVGHFIWFSPICYMHFFNLILGKRVKICQYTSPLAIGLRGEPTTNYIESWNNSRISFKSKKTVIEIDCQFKTKAMTPDNGELWKLWVSQLCTCSWTGETIQHCQATYLAVKYWIRVCDKLQQWAHFSLGKPNSTYS